MPPAHLLGRMYDAVVWRPVLGLGIRLGMGTALAAGCYAPSLPSGAPCMTDEGCLEDETCQMGRCDRPGGAGSNAIPGDRDGDGVPDSGDNCPDNANADQANDDGDARGNACDSCPFVADTGMDSDGDRLADACDPDPMGTVPDVQWLQNSFTTGIPTDYQPRTNGWTSTGGAIRADGSVEQDLGVPLGAPGRGFDHFALSIGATVESVPAGNNDALVGFYVDQPSSSTEIDCLIFQNGAHQELALYSTDKSTADASKDVAWTIGTAYTLQLAVQLVGTQRQYTCTLFDAQHQILASASGPFNVAPVGTEIGIWTLGMAAHIDWLFAAGKAP